MSSALGAGIELGRAERLTDLCARLGGTLDAPVRERSIQRVVLPQAAARESDLVLVSAPSFAVKAHACPGVVLCQKDLAPRLPAGNRWLHAHAEWALAELLDGVDQVSPPNDLRALAHVEAGAEVASSAVLGPGAVVLSGARVGAGASIGPNAVIYGRVVIGQRVSVGAGAVIGRPGFGWVTGPEGRVRRMPQLGGVVIEDDAEIGALATVDAGTLAPTRIGAGAKLDAHVHVGHNVEIGAGCLVAAQSGFAGSVVLESGVLVGGQVGVKDHVRVGAGARLAAKSGVIGDVPSGETVAGFPAVPRLRWLRAMARLLARPSR